MHADANTKIGLSGGDVLEKVGVETRISKRTGGLGERTNTWEDEFLSLVKVALILDPFKLVSKLVYRICQTSNVSCSVIEDIELGF